MALPHHPWSSEALGRAGPGECCLLQSTLLSRHKGALSVKPSGDMGQQPCRFRSPAGKQVLKPEGWDVIGSALLPLPGPLAAGEAPRSPHLKQGGSRGSQSAAKGRMLRAKAPSVPLPTGSGGGWSMLLREGERAPVRSFLPAAVAPSSRDLGIHPCISTLSLKAAL